MPYYNPTEDIPLTIPNGQSLSDAATLDGRAVVAVETPAAWTAADLSFQVSRDGATFVPLFVVTAPGVAVELTVPSAAIPTAAGRAFLLDPSWTLGWSALKVQSGIAGATVNQGGSRTLRVKARGI